MTEDELKGTAAQLRKPHGEYAPLIAQRMNIGNSVLYHNTILSMSLKPEEKILEIGMANGFFVKDIFMASPSAHYIGCDFSEEMVAAAILNNDSLVKEGRASFHLANAEKLPVDDNSIDTLFTVNTVYFWENPKIVLAEFKRVLKTKGKLIIAGRPKSYMKEYPFTKYGFTMYSKEELISLLSSNGFNVLDAIEKLEPVQEIAGIKVEVASLIVTASIV